VIQLPRALATWEAELSLFPEDVALGLGGLVARLALAIGPMRARAQRGHGVPDGYDGLTRRGDYGRLLMTEWLLADELPDEFVRRVAMGEHSFLARAYEQPASSRRSVVLFDTGPDQLGAPRIAHVAALVTFAQRAAAARAELAWGALQARAPLTEAVTPAAFTALLEARTKNSARDPDVEAGLLRAAPRGQHDELWIVGGARLAEAAATARASFVQIDDVLEPQERSLHVRIVPARGAARSVVLELPSPQMCARLLRDPFQLAVARPSPTETPVVRGAGNVVFAPDSRRIFARAEDGSLLSLALPNSPRAAPAPLTRFRPPSGQVIVAAGWLRGPKRMRVVTQRPDGGLVLHTLNKRSTQSNASLVFRMSDPAPPGALSLLWRLRDGDPCMLDGSGRVIRLREAGGEVDWVSVVAISTANGIDSCAAIALGDRVELVTRYEDAPFTTVRVPVSLARPPRVFFGAPAPRWLAAVESSEDAWTIVRPEGEGAIQETWQVPSDREVCGVTETQWSPPKPALVVLDASRRALRLFRPESTEVIVASEASIVSATASPSSRDVAYVTERGEIVVYSIGARAAIARISGGAS
jgi:hypothetical protein